MAGLEEVVKKKKLTPLQKAQEKIRNLKQELAESKRRRDSIERLYNEKVFEFRRYVKECAAILGCGEGAVRSHMRTLQQENATLSERARCSDGEINRQHELLKLFAIGAAEKRSEIVLDRRWEDC